MKSKEVLGHILTHTIAGFFLISPVLVGCGIFLLLNPTTFWQTLATFLVVLVLSGIEGFFAWMFAFAFEGWF